LKYCSAQRHTGCPFHRRTSLPCSLMAPPDPFPHHASCFWDTSSSHWNASCENRTTICSLLCTHA
jgi:hypothetical protein